MSTHVTTPAALTLPAQRTSPTADFHRPRHRKPVPDNHVIYLDVLLERLGLAEATGRHRAYTDRVVVLPTTDLAAAAGGAA